MKKMLVLLSVAAVCLAICAPAGAKEKKGKADRYANVNMNRVTCKDMLEEPDTQAVKAVVIWIDGYLSAQSGDTTVDVNELKALAERLKGYCEANPSATIMEAAKKAGRKKR